MEKIGQKKSDTSSQGNKSTQGNADDLNDIMDNLNLNGDNDIKKIFENGNQFLLLSKNLCSCLAK